MDASGRLLQPPMGWEGAALQIMRFQPWRDLEALEAEGQVEAERLAELMQKPTLTDFEAQRALAVL